MCIILYSNLIQLHSYFVYTGYLEIPNLSHNAPEQIDLSNKLLTSNYERIICYSYSYNKLLPHSCYGSYVCIWFCSVNPFTYYGTGYKPQVTSL